MFASGKIVVNRGYWIPSVGLGSRMAVSGA